MDAALARLDQQIAALGVARKAVERAVRDELCPEIEYALLGNLSSTLARLSTLAKVAGNAASREQAAAAPDTVQGALL